MVSRDLIVRIVKPAEQPQPPKRETTPILPRGKEKNTFHNILRGVGLAGIAALGIFLAVSFFNLGTALKDILILVGIPLAIGAAAGYAIS